MVEPGGQLVAMKGRSAEQEVAAATKALRKLRVSETAISEHGHGVLDEPTLTVDCTVGTRST